MKLSVKFFKRLILAVLALLILVPIIAALCLGVSNVALRKKLRLAEDQAAQIQADFTAAMAAAERGPTVTAQAISYQTLYPRLYCATPVPRQTRAEGTVYLTFNDGPSANTAEILDTLAQFGVKATFFVGGDLAGEDETALLRRIVAEGHTLGIHTYSHDYADIYRSVANYLADFDAVYQRILAVTGVQVEVFRFPGGSINSYNAGLYQELTAEMLRRGFCFYDWNVSGGETAHSNPQEISSAVLEGVQAQNRSIVLLHDSAGHGATADALPALLTTLLDEGYAVEPITSAVEPIWFSYQ